MTNQHIGEWAALATAMLWTLSALAWTSAGKHIGALAVSFPAATDGRRHVDGIRLLPPKVGLAL